MTQRHLYLVVALAASLAARSDSAQDLDIAGDWAGIASKDGATVPVGLHFERGSEGTIATTISLPAIHTFGAPIGAATVQGNEVEIGSWVLAYDPASGSLTADLPAWLVPVHRIPATFRRGALDRPARGELLAPDVSPVWTFDAGAPVWSDLAFAGGTVFVGAEDGRLHALDARTGSERWSLRTGGAIRAQAAIAGNDLYIPADDGFLYKLDLRTGKQAWRVRTDERPIERIPPGPKSRLNRRASAVSVSAKRLFVGTHDGHVLALDPRSGARIWAFAAGDTVLSTPALGGGRVFFGSYDGHVYALDAASGTILWKQPTGAPVVSTPAVFEGLVIVGSRSYDLVALDVKTGRPAWTRYFWFSWIESSVAIRDQAGYVGSSDAALLSAFDPRTGRDLWSLDIHGWAWGQPAVTARRVYVGVSALGGYPVSHQPGAVAVDRKTGKPAWRFALGLPKDPVAAGFPGSPVAGAGRVFFGGVDGRLYAFDE